MLPILLGSLIYVLYRKPTLLVFQWIDTVGLTPCIVLLRNQITLPLTSFIQYSLPDGLWCYAFAYTLFQIWKDESIIARYLIIGGIPMIGVVSELLQIPHWIQGTFDLNDVIAYGAAGIILYVISIQKGNINRDEKNNFNFTRIYGFRSFSGRKHGQ